MMSSFCSVTFLTLRLKMSQGFRAVCNMWIAAFFIVFFVTPISQVQALEQHTQIVSRAQWPSYVNGTNLLSLPQISQILTRFEEKDDTSILILYPNNDLGQNWARELGNWLISFGIPGNHLNTAPAIDNLNQLVITLTRP